MYAAMLRVILVLCLIAGTRPIEIKQFTVPSSIELGSEAELKCSYELNGTSKESNPYGVTVKWWRELANGERQQLYQRIPSAMEMPHAYHNASLGSLVDNIMISNVQPKDSGLYECEVSNLIDEKRRNQTLVVYSKGTGPNLTLAAVEDGPDDDDVDDILILCTAEDVTPEAELIISINKEEVNDTEVVAVSGDNDLYDYKVNITVSRARIGEAEVSCELFYENKNLSHPPYVSSLSLEEDEREDKSGDEVLSTTEATLDKISVDDHSGSGNIVGCMWVFLLVTLIPGHLLI